MDEIDTANNYKRNLLAHSLMVYRGCPTEVYRELNSSLVFQTDIGHEVDENLEGVVSNDTKKSKMQGFNGNMDKSFESECVDENDVTETFEESENVDKPFETENTFEHREPEEPENNAELMAFQQNSIKKKLYPRIILKRLNVSLTHPFKCTECQQRFHKVYEATDHYVTAHQSSNDLSKKEDKVIHGLLYIWTELLYFTCPHEASHLTLLISHKLIFKALR